MRRLAGLLLPAILTGLCSCAPAPLQPPPPIVLGVERCPTPAVPALPKIDPDTSLETERNLEALLARDAIMRRYIAGLQATVSCYEAQTSPTTSTGEDHGKPD